MNSPGVPQHLVQAINNSGGPVPVVQQNLSDTVGQYRSNPEQITLSPKLPEDFQNEVVRHELVHALQNRTIGMQPNDPIDAALRKRIGLPAQGASNAFNENTGRTLAENFAQFAGNRRYLSDAPDPMISMIMRSMGDRVFRPKQ
jgi:hypothetical protein